MYKCWEADPEKRPTFTEIASTVGGMLEADLKQVRLTLETALNPIDLLISFLLLLYTN